MEYFNSIIDIFKPPGKIETVRNQIIIEYDDIKLTHTIETNNFIIETSDYLSFHLLRLIVKKLNIIKEEWIQDSIKISNKLTSEYIICLTEILQTNFYDYCTICADKHDKLGMSYITTCSKPDCIKKIYHYPSSNKITDFYKSDQITLFLLIKTMCSAFNHPKVEKIFDVVPLVYPITNIKSLIPLVPKKWLNNDFEELTNFISESYDDYYLWKKLNDNISYALLINAISNNYYSMFSYKDLVTHDLKKKIILKETPEDVNDIEYYNINYSTEIENKIKSKLDNNLKYYYLYHGSPFHCWNSIIKNGLKSMSGTEFMTAGAAYGNGIYLSNKLSLSIYYAQQSVPFNYCMIGLFQIIENPETYKKTEQIYVIPNENILILRSLIKINKHKLNNNLYSQLDDYFIRQRIIDKNMSDKNLITLKNKRLSAELKLIEKVPEKFKVISYSDEQDSPWIIEINAKDKLYKLKIQFYNYPLSPPFFELMNFQKPIKGIIDKDYKINLPILNPGSWSISNKIVEVLDIIWTFFNNSY